MIIDKPVNYIPQNHPRYRPKWISGAEANEQTRIWRYYVMDAVQAGFFVAAGICMGLMMSFGLVVR